MRVSFRLENALPLGETRGNLCVARQRTEVADAEAETVARAAAPVPDRVAATVALLGDLDHDVARAVAHAVADKIALLVAPALLPLVADELVHALDQRSLGATRVDAPDTDCTDPGDTGATAEPPPSGMHTSS